METPILTAVDFRTHLPRILEKVAYTNERFVVQRYGHQMVAIVSYEDLQYLEQHRPLPPKPDTGQPEFQRPHAAAEVLGLMGTDVEAAVKQLYEHRKRKRDIRKRVLEMERAELEAEKQALAEQRAKQQREEEKLRLRRHWLHFGPRIMKDAALIAMYREVYEDRTDPEVWWWREGAWRELKLRGLTEGLSLPRPEDCPSAGPAN